jgi:hypothetical protein
MSTGGGVKPRHCRAANKERSQKGNDDYVCEKINQKVTQHICAKVSMYISF